MIRRLIYDPARRSWRARYEATAREYLLAATILIAAALAAWFYAQTL